MAPTDAELKKLFEAYDKDGSGTIDYDELAAALARGGKQLSKEDIEGIVKLVDKNNVKTTRKGFETATRRPLFPPRTP